MGSKSQARSCEASHTPPVRFVFFFSCRSIDGAGPRSGTCNPPPKVLPLPPRNKCPDGGGHGVLTAPRISISRVCPMSDLVRLEPGCQAATLWLSPSHSRGSLCEANRGYRVIKLLSTMDVLCMCANGKHTVKSLVPMREGRQPPETNGLIDLGLFGDAGSPQRY